MIEAESGRANLRMVIEAIGSERRERADRAWRAGQIDGPRHGTAGLLEEVLSSSSDAGMIDLGRLLDRVVTLVQLSSTAVSFAATSVSTIVVEADHAQAVAAAVRELIYAFECAVGAGGSVSLYVAADWDGADLTVALACPEAAASPVPCATGTAAIARADLLVALSGGTMVRGIRDGRALFGLSFGWTYRD